MKLPQIDDALIFAGLAVTIPHTAHILCQYEAQDGWGYSVAWSFAVFTDVGIARCSWVASNRQANVAARKAFGGGLVFLLAVSYSLNAAYYFNQKADAISGLWLALVAPALLAILAAGKSLLDNKAVEAEKLKPVITPAYKENREPLVTSAADSSGPLEDGTKIPEKDLLNVVQSSLVDDGNKSEQVRRMKAEGLSWSQIASHFGKSPSTVRGWLQD